jgi:hypothetical protein
MLVPTLDVDLFWHTYQFAPVAYHVWCERNIGRRINHDDTISKETLEGALITTKDAWAQRYYEDYMFTTRDPTMLPDLRAKLKASEQCKIDAEKALEDYGSRFHDWETIDLKTESKNKKEIKELAARLGEIIVLQQELTAGEAKIGVQSENTGPPCNLLHFFAQVKEAREAKRKRAKGKIDPAEMLSTVNMELMIRPERAADLEQTCKGWVQGRFGLELKINPPAYQPSVLSRCAYEP